MAACQCKPSPAKPFPVCPARAKDGGRGDAEGGGGAAAAADGGEPAGPGAVGAAAERGVPGAHQVRGEQQERRQRLVPPGVQQGGHAIPVTYPGTAPEIAIPELDGKTAKMYRGGKICLTEHFRPLWARNVPKFGLAHLMALGVSVGESRGSVWGWRCGATHGICSHSAAGPLAGRGDPRPHRQGPGPAQGEMTGADPGPPLAGAGLSLRAIPTPSKSDSPIPRSSLPALFPPFLQ
uniref:Ubiquitin-fold modifier-conjugating enzyme 1 n=1 Tax=Apteryx owenii TaxID=8824 RepID=A0A8B9P890_APTOW